MWSKRELNAQLLGGNWSQCTIRTTRSTLLQHIPDRGNHKGKPVRRLSAVGALRWVSCGPNQRYFTPRVSYRRWSHLGLDFIVHYVHYKFRYPMSSGDNSSYTFGADIAVAMTDESSAGNQSSPGDVSSSVNISSRQSESSRRNTTPPPPVGRKSQSMVKSKSHSPRASEAIEDGSVQQKARSRSPKSSSDIHDEIMELRRELEKAHSMNSSYEAQYAEAQRIVNKVMKENRDLKEETTSMEHRYHDELRNYQETIQQGVQGMYSELNEAYVELQEKNAELAVAAQEDEGSTMRIHELEHKYGLSQQQIQHIIQRGNEMKEQFTNEVDELRAMMAINQHRANQMTEATIQNERVNSFLMEEGRVVLSQRDQSLAASHQYALSALTCARTMRNWRTKRRISGTPYLREELALQARKVNENYDSRIREVRKLNEKRVNGLLEEIMTFQKQIANLQTDFTEKGLQLQRSRMRNNNQTVEFESEVQLCDNYRHSLATAGCRSAICSIWSPKLWLEVWMGRPQLAHLHEGLHSSYTFLQPETCFVSPRWFLRSCSPFDPWFISLHCSAHDRSFNRNLMVVTGSCVTLNSTRCWTSLPRPAPSTCSAVEVFTAIAASDSRLRHAPPSTLGFTMPRVGLLLDLRTVSLFSGHPTTGRRRSALRTRQKNCGLGNLGIEMLHTYILHAHTIHVHITILVFWCS